MKHATARAAWPPTSASGELPFEDSIGYQIRATHRTLQRYLQMMIEPHGVSSGSWYFLRALWHEDGLTQRQLAVRIGIREPTVLMTIKDMEARGLVKRVRSEADRRKIHVWLTPRAKRLKSKLIPLARHVVATAAASLTTPEVRRLLKQLSEIQNGLNAAIARGGGAPAAPRTAARRPS
jgi:DNA-binding MarR family transcriptional regulator